MNSSTSSSDAAAWRGFVATFFGTLAALTVGLLAAVALLDPYDRGAFGEPHRGTPEAAPRVADASRVRDPAFDAAVIGNSHIQLVDPAALSRATGFHFVSLAVPGTGPREQLAILDAFLRHHGEGTRALALGLDPAWCTEDPALPMTNPFPFWLYDPSPAAYLGGLMRFAALEQAARRVGFLLGLAAPARRDGYWNYAAGRTPSFAAPARAEPAGPAGEVIDDARRFPALDRLGERLAHLPGDARVALVRPPVHASALPPPASTPARAEAACLRATERLAARHAGTILVDLRRGDPGAADDAQWFDDGHYGEPVARRVEAAIAAALPIMGTTPNAQ
ncbi:hypothetical protein [Lichenibacterium dinghuense]|uniref:hypothetical protein n=1 Tax=Lichenibacterium dinghuense TaxID=2895977 RepID=UPI001F411271|nr:hypothetical protein [Lichenibacterium sp. 6Y81]